MSAGEILWGGVGAMLTPAGLVLIPPAVAWTLVLVRREQIGRSAIGIVLLVTAFVVAAWALRPSLVPTPSPPLARLWGAGLLRDAAFLGVLWALAGVLASRRQRTWPWLALPAWAVGGLLLAPLIPPVQGPVLAVVTGPSAPLASLGARGLYDVGMGLALGFVVVLAALLGLRLPRRLARGIGGGVLVVWGGCLASGVYGRLVAVLLQRWPALGLG